MYLSHADGDPITDPRTLKSSTKTCAFENLYGAFRSVFLYFESTIGRLHILAENFFMHILVVEYCKETLKIICSASENCAPFLVTFGFRRSSISALIPIPYTAHARGITLRCAIGRFQNL